MRNKIIASIIGGCLLVAATAPTPEPVDSSLDAAVDWCAVAQVAYRSGPAGREKIKNEWAKFDSKTQGALGVVCFAYTRGYDKGRTDLMRNTT